jgi:hypothetical protein
MGADHFADGPRRKAMHTALHQTPSLNAAFQITDWSCSVISRSKRSDQVWSEKAHQGHYPRQNMHCDGPLSEQLEPVNTQPSDHFGVRTTLFTSPHASVTAATQSPVDSYSGDRYSTNSWTRGRKGFPAANWKNWYPYRNHYCSWEYSEEPIPLFLGLLCVLLSFPTDWGH